MKLDFKPTLIDATHQTDAGPIDVTIHVSLYTDREPIVTADIWDRRGLAADADLSVDQIVFTWRDYEHTDARGDAAVEAAKSALEAAMPAILASEPRSLAKTRAAQEEERTCV